MVVPHVHFSFITSFLKGKWLFKQKRGKTVARDRAAQRTTKFEVSLQIAPEVLASYHEFVIDF